MTAKTIYTVVVADDEDVLRDALLISFHFENGI